MNPRNCENKQIKQPANNKLCSTNHRKFLRSQCGGNPDTSSPYKERAQHNSRWKRTTDEVGCWSFMSWQHLRSDQDVYCLDTVCTHGCCPTGGTPAPGPHIPLTLSWPRVIQFLSYPNKADHITRKWQVSNWSNWFDSTRVWTPVGSNSTISVNWRLVLNSFSHPVWFMGEGKVVWSDDINILQN